MIGSTGRRRLLICWGVSILLHAGLLTLGVASLIKQVRFHVEAGKASTEINLVIEPAPVPVTAPPTPPPVPAPVPEPIKAQVTTLPAPIFIPPRPSVVAPAKPHSPSPSATLKPSPAEETSNAAKGAIQAEPDELHNEPPEYPEESRIAREQGLVTLRVEVSALGQPSNVSILKSSGYFRLDQAARRAVQHWKFHPAMTAGIPVSSEADVPVHFRLE